MRKTIGEGGRGGRRMQRENKYRGDGEGMCTGPFLRGGFSGSNLPVGPIMLILTHYFNGNLRLKYPNPPPNKPPQTKILNTALSVQREKNYRGRGEGVCSWRKTIGGGGERVCSRRKTIRSRADQTLE